MKKILLLLVLFVSVVSVSFSQHVRDWIAQMTTYDTGGVPEGSRLNLVLFIHLDGS